MGRFADLCATLAAEADESPAGLMLSAELHDRLLGEGWDDDDIEDAAELVRQSLLQMELTQATDSLSGALIEWLGGLADEAEFQRLAAGKASISLDLVARLARRVEYLEEILAVARDDESPDLSGLVALRRRLSSTEDD